MNVSNEITVYQVRNRETTISDNVEPLKVTSDWNKTKIVHLKWGEVDIAVYGYEVKAAIDNALNCPR